MKEILTTYQDRLTDLTAKNKSLRLLSLANKHHFDLAQLNKIQDRIAETVLDQVLELKEKIPLLPQNLLDEEAMVMNRHLVQLKREIDLIEQETGTNVFYMAYGFLEGYLYEDLYIRAPLLFYPARLVRENIRTTPYWVMEVGEDSVPFMNRTFLMAIHKYLGVNLISRVEEVLEKIPRKKGEIISFLAELLQESNLSLTVAEGEMILPCKNMKKADIPAGVKGFTLYPYAVIGKFQQSTSTLLNDYKFLLDNIPESGFLVEVLNGVDREDGDYEEVNVEELNHVKEEETFFVMETDASQEAVVVASRKQKGLIVHGPPGTGKSQVIVNLIVDRLARGERVLLVCQKPTALRVVYNRLGKIQLQSQVALVPDFNKCKADLFRKIQSILTKQVDWLVSQDHQRISDEMTTLATKLNQIAQSLHDVRSFGKSLYQLYSQAAWDQEQIIDVSDLLEGISHQSLLAELVNLRNIMELMQKYDHPMHPWKERKSFAAFGTQQLMELKRLLSTLVQDVTKAAKIRNRFEVVFEPQYFLQNQKVLQELGKALQMLQNRSLHRNIMRFYQDENREFETADQLETVKNSFASLKRQIDWVSSHAEPSTAFGVEEAQHWHQKITVFLEANSKLSRFFSPQWYHLHKELQDHCRKMNICYDGHTVRQHQERMESFLAFEKMRKEAITHHWFADAPPLNRVPDWEKWIHSKSQTLIFLEMFVQVQIIFPKWLQNPDSLEALEELGKDLFLEQVQAFLELSQITERIQSAMEPLRTFLQTEEVNLLLRDSNQGIYMIERYQALLDALDHFDSLCRLDQMKTAMGAFQQKIIERCEEKMPIATTEQLKESWVP